MFRIVKLVDVSDYLNEDNFIVEEAFFFTYTSKGKYVLYNHDNMVVGVVPLDYNLFFRVDAMEMFEDIDMGNLVRMFDNGMSFQLAATQANNNKITILDSKDIASIVFDEEGEVIIPFTSYPFDSDGLVVFKNMVSIADTLEDDRVY